MPRIRRSPISSSRRNGWPISAPSWRPAAPGPRRTRPSGRPIPSWSKASPAEALSTKPTEGGFLAGAAGFVHRCRSIDGRPLSNTTGSVLDPIFSLRRRVRLAPGESAHLIFSTLVGPSREVAVALADKYRDPATFERTVTLAWTQAQVQLNHLGVDVDEARLFQDLAGRILYADATLRPAAAVLGQNASGPSALWAHGISGDLPIVLVRIDEPEDRGIVRQLLRAHEYWRLKGLGVDLVILNERAHSYTEELQASLEALVRTSQSASRHERHETHGKVFILRKDLLRPPERDALQTAARAILLSRHGTLAEQLCACHGHAERGRPASPPRGQGRVPGRRAACPPGVRVLQRLGRVRRRRAGIRHRPRRGAMDARALDQRRRESRVRFPGLRERGGIHVGA